MSRALASPSVVAEQGSRPQHRDDLEDALVGLGLLVRFFALSQCAMTADDFQKSFADETELTLAVA